MNRFAARVLTGMILAGATLVSGVTLPTGAARADSWSHGSHGKSYYYQHPGKYKGHGCYNCGPKYYGYKPSPPYGYAWGWHKQYYYSHPGKPYYKNSQSYYCGHHKGGHHKGGYHKGGHHEGKHGGGHHKHDGHKSHGHHH